MSPELAVERVQIFPDRAGYRNPRPPPIVPNVLTRESSQDAARVVAGETAQQRFALGQQTAGRLRLSDAEPVNRALDDRAKVQGAEVIVRAPHLRVRAR